MLIWGNVSVPSATCSFHVLFYPASLILCSVEEVRLYTFVFLVFDQVSHWYFEMTHLHSSHTIPQFSVPYCINPCHLTLYICAPAPALSSVLAEAFLSPIWYGRGKQKKTSRDWTFILTCTQWWTHSTCGGTQGKMWTWHVHIAQAMSLMQPHRTRVDPMLNTAHTKKWLYMSIRLSSPATATKVCSPALILPWNPSQYVCLERMCGRQGKWKGEKDCLIKSLYWQVWVNRDKSLLPSSIQWSSSRGERASTCFVGTEVHHECLCGRVVWYMLVSRGVFVSYRDSACSESRLNHFTQWRVLEETPKPQLRL